LNSTSVHHRATEFLITNELKVCGFPNSALDLQVGCLLFSEGEGAEQIATIKPDRKLFSVSSPLIRNDPPASTINRRIRKAAHRPND
jgi:hypothetical protein